MLKKILSWFHIHHPMESETVKPDEEVKQKHVSPPQSDWELKGEDEITLLKNDLHKGDSQRRVEAMVRIGNLANDGLDFSEVIPALLRNAASGNSKLSQVAYETLNKLDAHWIRNPVVLNALSTVVDMVERTVDSSSRAASKLVEKIGEPCIPYLIGLLQKSNNPNLETLRLIGSMGIAASDSIPVLQKIYEDCDHELVKENIIKNLAKVCGSLDKISFTLISALHDESPEVRLTAAEVFVMYNKDVEVAFPALVLSLTEKDESKVMRAKNAFIRIGDKSIPMLLELFRSRGTNRLNAATKCIGDIFKFSNRLQPGLYRYRDELENSFSWHYEAAFDKLEREERVNEIILEVLKSIQIGDSYWEELIPVLEEATQDSNPQIRQLAFEILGRGTPKAEAITKILLDLLESDKNKYDVHVWSALYDVNNGSLPDAAMSEIPFLISMLDKRETMDTAHKLLLITGRKAVPQLSSALTESENRILREEICRVLGKIGPAASDALVSLLQMAEKDANRFVRDAARQAIMLIKGDGVQ